MSQIDDETAVVAAGDGRYLTELRADWNIGENPNGGYAMMPVLRAVTDAAGRPDPMSVTVHYLRPSVGEMPGEIATQVVRAGRAATFVTGSLIQEGVPRLTLAAILGDLTTPASDAPDPVLTVPAPAIPSAEECVDRATLGQGVTLPLLSRVEVRVRPDPSPGAAVVDGWIRFRDGTPPAACWLPLFADAFPPALHQRVEQIGWVPTLELTVHVRRRPVAGWVQAHIECDDVAGGRMIETATLWDSSGALVARARQLGLQLTRPP